MFGTYNIISLVVLLNMLIAMMNNSYQHIADHADMEWKFARTKLWMSYFEEGGTLPSPFNIIPSPKSVVYLIGWIKRQLLKRTSIQKLETFETLGRRAAENISYSHEYQEVMKNLVKRYVAAMIRDAKTKEGLTEDNFKELKQDISSFRYEVLGMMKGKRHSHSGLAGQVASATLAYPGNSFKYSPVFPPAEMQQKLNLFDVPAVNLQRGAAASGAASSNTPSSVSVGLSEKQTHDEVPKDVSDVGVPQRRSRNPSHTFDEIVSEGDSFESGGQNQRQLQAVLADVAQEEEKDVEETDRFQKDPAEEVNNGLKRRKT
ncbi:hypothetical protein LDENG_00202600 [Lucifuga dentata]|nr:hypothetical protein LDENG_00202600 [Lucifuga dentata]